MPVCRLIFRLDFELNFQIVDHPGEVMRMITQLPDEILSELRESSGRRGIAGWYKSDDGDLVRQFAVEPRSVVASIESLEGIEINRLISNEGFETLTKMADSVCEMFKVETIQRSGLRLFYFSKLHNEDRVVKAFGSVLPEGLTDGVNEVLGPIQDYGINFDGGSAQGFKYHIRSGPLRKEENKSQYFEHINELFQDSSDFDFACDIDFYEHDFAPSKIPIRRWHRPMIKKANDLIDLIEAQITSYMER